MQVEDLGLRNQFEELIKIRGMRAYFDFTPDNYNIWFGYGDNFKETGIHAWNIDQIELFIDCIRCLQNWDSNITNNL